MDRVGRIISDEDGGVVSFVGKRVLMSIAPVCVWCRWI